MRVTYKLQKTGLTYYEEEAHLMSQLVVEVWPGGRLSMSSS